MRRATVLAVFLLVILLSVSGWGQEVETPKIGIGAHLGWPTLIGPSVKAWITPLVGMQGMASFFSVDDHSLTMLAGRGFLRLVKEDKKVFPYIGGGFGAWIAKGTELHLEWNNATGDYFWIERDEEETVLTFELFLGFEHKYSKEFHGDYEIGYYSINFDEVDVGVSGMSFNYAVHYFF